MKITGKKVGEFYNALKNQNCTYKLCLLFGQDESVISSKSRDILNIFKDKNIVNISSDEIKNNPSRIFEEFQSISFFSDKTIIVVKLSERPNDITKNIKQIFENLDINNNNFILLIAGDLTTSSSLRKFCEDNEYTVAIGCYSETESDILNFIRTKLKEYNFTFNTDVINKIYSNIGNNTLLIEKEIEKIALYKDTDKNLTIYDIENTTKDISESEISEFINYFCTLNKDKTFNSLDKLLKENQKIVLIRSLISHFLLIQKIQYRISIGENIENAIKSEKVFWKEQITIRKHLEFWDLKKINNMLEKFIDLEKNKFSSTNIEFKDFILRTFMVFKKYL